MRAPDGKLAYAVRQVSVKERRRMKLSGYRTVLGSVLLGAAAWSVSLAGAPDAQAQA